MAQKVSGKTALVTGGGSGICLEFTKLLIEKGCNVLVADITLLPEAEEFINGTKGAKVRAVFQKTDVTSWTQLQAAFAKAISEFGSLNIVCPGAGVFEPAFSNFWLPQTGKDTVATSSYKTLDINITHPVRCTQLAIDTFKRQTPSSGSVVLVSSIAAQLPLLICPLYGLSKAAISSFTRSLGFLEPQTGIRVNAVAPGIVKTPIWTPDKLAVFEEGKDEWVTPRKVAEVMLQLVEEEAFVGGTVLEVGSENPRLVATLHDPGPQGRGVAVSKMGDGIEKTFEIIETNFGKGNAGDW